MTDDIPETGAVFTFGKSHFADNEPSHFFIKNDPVVAISCGDEHSAVICHNGRVFVFGGNAWGQLGLGHKDEVTRPSCVKWLKPHRAMFVACGRAHTVFVTDSNAIYSVGCNDEGQLGTGDMEHHTVPQFVELEGDPKPIRQVSAGSNHTAILTDEGRVFMCGSNSEGQLGLGEDTRSSVKFTELKFMEKIAFVECGYYHTVFITEQGAVFVTGDNENMKLGVPNAATTIYVPEVLPINIPIKSACCGASHTFLLSMDESKILAFGSNERGQLGMPKDVVNVSEPTEIDMETMFEGYQLKLVACGAMHTAFVTDNGLLYTCGESRHNKLCLEEIDGTDNSNEATPNQYSPKRVTAMNGFVVDNVACGGCHTLLTATKGSNADFTNNDFNIINEETRQISLTELPPLQKVPVMNKPEDTQITGDVTDSNINEHVNPDNVNGNTHEETGSIDSLEANVSGSHIVNINDLEIDNASTHEVPDIKTDEIESSVMEESKSMDIIETMDTMVERTEEKIEESVKDISHKVDEKVEVVENVVKKVAAVIPDIHHVEKKVLEIPDKVAEIANSPPPKTPILQDLLHVPDISQMSPVLSKHSDDGQKSEGGESENETIPCGSDKSSPQAGKTAKTQAVMPIVRSEDAIDDNDESGNNEENDVVVKKGRFARIFQSIRDKENSCMSKGKVIEENVVENVHKGIEGTEQTIHKLEETVETEIRNQTNSRTCTLL
ncbi:X-linked retinitis pigmentosa GTPase regulator-like [Galleria mellonella]|uniref:X-linked retinitis pigmentosa GTPase regulator-like n=1 Tax=Galleria mellonella TaxID=7137 RepID=A0ABM3MG80_GALME|nr:X-linked retinitis pigmentosa GTPase regulator-like [Galleria mellonella]